MVLPSAQPGISGQARWMALADLAGKEFPHATQFFIQGLDLLVKQLDVDRAALTRTTSQGLETCWWALGESVGEEDAIHETDEFFGPRVMDAPTKALSIPDLEADPELAGHPSARRLGIRAYLGLINDGYALPYGEALALEHRISSAANGAVDAETVEANRRQVMARGRTQ